MLLALIYLKVKSPTDNDYRCGSCQVSIRTIPVSYNNIMSFSKGNNIWFLNPPHTTPFSTKLHHQKQQRWNSPHSGKIKLQNSHYYFVWLTSPPMLTLESRDFRLRHTGDADQSRAPRSTCWCLNIRCCALIRRRQSNSNDNKRSFASCNRWYSFGRCDSLRAVGIKLAASLWLDVEHSMLYCLV